MLFLSVLRAADLSFADCAGTMRGCTSRQAESAHHIHDGLTLCLPLIRHFRGAARAAHMLSTESGALATLRLYRVSERRCQQGLYGAVSVCGSAHISHSCELLMWYRGAVCMSSLSPRWPENIL